MNTIHTKGPWTFRKCKNRYKFSGFQWEDFGGIFHTVEGYAYPDPVALANAKLIAAAPELFRSLVTMTALCRIKYGNLEEDVWQEIEKANAIIEKVTN